MIHARNDYNRIQDPANLITEPVFLLRAQDSLAAKTVAYWADLNDQNGGDPELSERARAHALKMQEWPTHKLPDGRPAAI